MSYGQGVKVQYWPNQNCLNFFRCGNEKKLKIKRSFLKICSKKKISGLGPCETSRPDVSENVELIGRGSF